MLPVISWPEGKQRLSRYILERFPASIYMFIDPFCGALSIALQAAMEFEDNIAYRLSDNNKDIVSAHQTLIEDPSSLIKELRTMMLEWSFYDNIEKKRFYFARRAEYNRNECGAIRKAALFFFLCRTSFNGLWRTNTNGEMNTPIGDINKIGDVIIDIDNMKNVGDFLRKSNVMFQKCDFKLAITRAIERAALGYNNQFVFLDPPRYTLGDNRFPWEQRKILASFLQDMDDNGIKWMLIDRDDDITINLYAVWRINFIETSNMKRSKTHDLLITNYEVFVD